MSDRSGGVPVALSDEWGRFRVFLWGRLGMCAAILAAIGIASFVAGSTSRMALVVAPVLVVVALTVPYRWWGRRHPARLPAAYASILLGDALLTTVGAYFLGGENAVYGLPIYGIYVVMAAALLAWRGAFLVAGTAAVFYGAMALATGAAWLPEQPSAFAFRYSDAWAWMTAIVNTFAVFAIAFVAGSLGEVTRRSMDRSRSLESRLRDANRGLEQRVDEAVCGLREANASLSRKNEELERTLVEVEVFARAVSHDVRNPVTAAGEALRLEPGSEGSARERLLRLASENLLRADRMLLGLRDLMRTVGSSSGAQRVTVSSLVEDVVAELRAARAGEPLPVRVGGNLGEVAFPSEPLRHVFRNLLSNALGHNQGRLGLLVEVGRATRDGDAEFFVRDNGAGIGADVRARIFEPFRRGPEAMGEGLGLGLALVRTIITQAGGQIFLESAPGKGATFRFTLPSPSQE
jgi:signal transduction histidine kinase